MAKITDLLKFLLVAAFCVCVYAGSAGIGEGEGPVAPAVGAFGGSAGIGEGPGDPGNGVYAGSAHLTSGAVAGVVNRVVNQKQDAKSLRLALQKIYTAELGVREKTGKNDGDRVKTYLRYVHLKASNPWCAAFVCWGLGQAGIPNPRSGWSPDLLPNSKLIWQRSRGLLKQGKTPEAGDVFGIWFPEKGRVAHVGFVDEWSGKYLVTVEGNTNVSGGIEGDRVYRRRRMISSVYKVADYIGGKSL